MADNVQLNAPTSVGATIATDDIGGVQHQLVKVEFGADGVATQVSAAAPLPVVQTGTPALPTGAATAANQQTDALTDAELRATPVPISGTVSTGGLTDAQLRSTPVPISGTVSTGLSQPLTDAQLRATPVPVSGTVTANAGTNLNTSALALETGGNLATIKTNTDKIPALGQALESASVPVVLTAAQISTITPPAAITGFATSAKQDTLLAELQLKADLTDTQPVSLATLPALPAGTNNIGDVDVLTLPSIPAGNNNIGDVDIASIAAGDNNIGNVDVVTLPSLPAGTNNIGDVDVLTLPALPAGNNNIGDVDVASVIPGTGATNLGKAEDAGHTTGDIGVMSLGVSNEAGSALVNANLDYTPIATDKMGQIYVNPENNKVIFRGRSATFRTLGRAGTAGQKIAAIHNATGSSVTVNVKKIMVDMWATVVKAITVPPPIIRIWKFTAVPTNGTAMTKNKIGGTGASSASVTLWNDSTADGSGSATTLTVTLPAGTIVDQLVPPRIITAVGEVDTNPLIFEYPAGIQLAALEGICVFVDYTGATSNPTTDMWFSSIEWEEWTT